MIGRSQRSKLLTTMEQRVLLSGVVDGVHVKEG